MVYTAIGVYDPHIERLLTDLCATRVWMRSYSDAELEAYIASGDPFDKAGGYAIQNPEFHPVERIEGCYDCVMGLALCSVVDTLRQFGLTPPLDVMCECQKTPGRI
jgi:predicted house-cleaning NTP pyrophosphatase (Maf/HAM1 superfamily)